MTSTSEAATLFVVAVALALGASAFLVTRLERIGERLGFTEAILGVVAALAADSPEISSAVTAMARGQRTVSIGVILGSNAFNLAALLGVAAVVAGGIAFHRRVVALEGLVALSMVALSVGVVVHVLPGAAALVLALAVVIPYLVVSGLSRSSLRRLPLPARWLDWLARALGEEEAELSEAIRPPRGRPVDAVVAVVSLGVVVGASVVMVDTATRLGTRYGLSSIVVGGVLLAVVTSLPNAVAGIYLASRGRGAATLAVAFNSNTINVTIGLLVPAALVGLGPATSGATLTVVGYAGITILTLVLAYAGKGVSPWAGGAIVLAYAVLVAALLAL